MRATRRLLALILVTFSAPDGQGADDASRADGTEGVEFFESRVRPVLAGHCYECHSTRSGKSESGLRVDTRDAIRAGGDRGPAVVPGDPESSWLITAVSHSDPDLQMPPKQEQLPAGVIADLKTWIRMGAPDPRDAAAAGTAPAWGDPAEQRNYWSYQAPRDTPPPAVHDVSWARRDLDKYVLAALEQHNLRPSADAERGVLVRRLYFDLIGIPPTPQDSARLIGFSAEELETALASLVDELLATPQFGERWGRHWLDVARFGESSGKESNISFPYAWRYRDYVIDCVNADMPFDRFLQEQIAGDLLPCADEAERARLLIATGFLAVGTKNLEEGNPLQFAADVIDEQIDSVTRAVLGNSVACARCHDHKFDPFSMEDYYALAGIFASTKTYFGTAVSPANRVGGDPLVLPQAAGLKVFHPSLTPEKVAELKAQLAALNKEQEDKQAAAWKAIAAGEDASEIFTLRDALRIFWQSGGIEGQLEKVDESGRALPLAMGVLDGDTMVDAPLLDRGEVTKPGKEVPRGFPSAIHVENTPAIADGRSGRLELAEWLTRPDHPLTARVIVNRVWRHLLGAGIVATVDNFGTTGEPPSHPELLDHLALRFAGNGWSVKQVVREIVLSRTYRQASTFREEAFLKDPDNRLLWRMPKRRLEAEAIRDAMLAASGELDLARPEGSLVATVIGDRPISLIGLDQRLPADLDGAVYRSVYLPVIRDRLPDVLELFDFAEPSLVTGDRSQTNVPIQALYLMNSPFVRARAEALAARLEREAESDSLRAQRAFALCFSRSPDDDEQARALQFLEGRPATVAEGVDVQHETLVNFCQALLATAEFRNLD